MQANNLLNINFAMSRLHCFVAVFALIIFTSCGGSGGDSETLTPPPEPPTRSFYMGFTPWFYEASFEAMELTYSRIADHGDMIKHHFLGGIPWQEALDQTDYHANVENNIQNRLNQTAAGTKVFLAIDSLNAARDGLSPNWSENENEGHTGEWVDRSWSSPEVITAYLNFAVDMINRFQPTHFEYGTEASELIINDPVGFAEYMIFAQAVYSSLSALYPDLKLMTSVALKTPGSDHMRLIEASYSELLPYTDVIGISVYPYAFFSHADKGDPANLPSDWLTQINNLSTTKPFAISETGWIAENLDIPEFSYSEQSDSAKQRAYVNELMSASDDLNMEFVIWWTTTDFDTLWNNELSQDPLAKIWKDIGFYDENQNPREALQLWDSWLVRDVSSN